MTSKFIKPRRPAKPPRPLRPRRPFILSYKGENSTGVGDQAVLIRALKALGQSSVSFTKGDVTFIITKKGIRVKHYNELTPKEGRINKGIQTRYANALKRYPERVKAWEKKMAVHKEALASYELDLADYNRQKAEANYRDIISKRKE